MAFSGSLKKRARSLGATSEQIEALDDADDIKAATIELVKSLRSALDAMSFRELKRLLRRHRLERHEARLIASDAGVKKNKQTLYYGVAS